MTSDDLRELIEREPFEPIRLRLSNGDVYDIVDPNAVVVMKSRVFIALPDDRFRLIALIHLVSVESLRAA